MKRCHQRVLFGGFPPQIVQRTIHTKICTSRIQSLTHLLVSTAGHGAWSSLWESNCLARRCHCAAHHPHKNLPEFNHSLTRLSRQLAMAPGAISGSQIASPAGVIVLFGVSARLILGSSTTRCHTLAASFHSIQQFTLVYHTRRDTLPYLTKSFILLDIHFGALHSA